VDLAVTKESSKGGSLLVRGCTHGIERDNMPCSFYVEVEGEAEGVHTDGRYNITFATPVASDSGNDYSVHVRFCADVKNCEPHMNVYNPMQRNAYDAYYGYEPFSIRVIPGPVDARYCTALGPDLIEGGLVGITTGFLIVARDAQGNRQLEGGVRFEVLIYQPQGKGLHTGVLIDDNNNGTYSVVYIAAVDGLHSVIAMLDYVPIQGSPFDPVYRWVLNEPSRTIHISVEFRIGRTKNAAGFCGEN